jgi:hypothetical protein
MYDITNIYYSVSELLGGEGSKWGKFETGNMLSETTPTYENQF